MKDEKGRYVGRPLEDYLVLGDKVITSQHNLKKRLVKEGFLRFECAWCSITEWRGLPAPLQLDHINGNPLDNRLENLRFLCANCHSQTDTYCSKNKHGLRVEAKKYECADCGAPRGRRAKWCKPCGYKNRDWSNGRSAKKE